MKKTVNLAGFITATALGIGAVAHQYGTSLREMCDGAVGSNLFSSFAESATGEDFSRPGKWVSVTGSAVCDTVGAIEEPVTRIARGVRDFVFKG